MECFTLVVSQASWLLCSASFSGKQVGAIWLSRYLSAKRAIISPAPAHDRPLADISEKLHLSKEQVFLVPLGQDLGCQVRPH